MTNNIEEIVKCIEDCGYEVFAYSGRGMCGKLCLGTRVETLSRLFRLGYDVCYYDYYIKDPCVDTLGLGYVAYWPEIEYGENDD